MTYDPYTEEVPFAEDPRSRPARDLETELREVIELIASAKQMPLSNSALIPRDEVLGRLEDALRVLPEEVREARWALRDREELMAAEMAKAQQLMDQVRAEAARMVDRTEIVRQSRLKADQIVADARAEARQLINQAEDFIDAKLGGFEIVLERLMKTAHSGRERLSAQVAPASVSGAESLPDDVLAPAPAPPAPSGGGDDSFFDQDAF